MEESLSVQADELELEPQELVERPTPHADYIDLEARWRSDHLHLIELFSHLKPRDCKTILEWVLKSDNFRVSAKTLQFWLGYLGKQRQAAYLRQEAAKRADDDELAVTRDFATQLGCTTTE